MTDDATSGADPHDSDIAQGARELIVLAAPDAALEITPTTARSAAGLDVAPLADLAGTPGIVFQPVFGDEERLHRSLEDAPGITDPTEVDHLSAEMARVFAVDAPDDDLDDLAAQLNAMDVIEAAYVKPPAVLAVLTREDHPRVEVHSLNDMAPRLDEAPSTTPDFTARQGYLDAAPGGIDARHAWTLPGGRGAGVQVIDCEWGWRFTHEDLRIRQGGVVVGTNSTDSNHGTAVLGEISGDVNAFGVTGIAPDAMVFGAAFSLPTAQVIRAAADRLNAGDILLLEIHRAGPRATGVGQQGYIAVEWWPDDYLAIRYAVNKGVIVVEAAGNGAQNLDDPVYDTRPAGFPSWWVNPFRRTTLDSGAVVVGAGAPPPGTHGRNHGTDRSRLDFSNYGACIDAQGWGREVTTTGYGDLQGGSNPDLWYSDTFSGTSSASPIVVGALACVQGILKAQGRIPLSPARSRELLRATGSPQQDTTGRPRTQRIGNRPNLRQLIPMATEQGSWVGVQIRSRLAANASQRWFTHSWPAHWHMVWSAVPTSPRPGGPALEWSVRAERANDRHITYWIDVKNLVPEAVDYEIRYAVLGW